MSAPAFRPRRRHWCALLLVFTLAACTLTPEPGPTARSAGGAPAPSSAASATDRNFEVLPPGRTTPGPSTAPRLALVIGNSQYDPGALRNPANDATDMAAALQQAGFMSVTRLLEADKAQMAAAVQDLARQLRQAPGSVGLVYFAGHGQLIEGQNYLLPVRTTIETQVDVKHRAVAAEWVLERLEETGNALNLLILDACRDNPLTRQWRSGQQGLGPMSAGLGKQTLIAFATLAGKVAADRSGGRNSPYTTALLQHLRTPGLEVGELFQRVRVEVERTTQGKQTPQEWTTMKSPFYFVVAPPSPPVPAPQPTRDPEAAAWEVVASSSHAEDLRAFLQAYPQGRFRQAALLKLQQLERTPPAPALPGPAVAVGVPLAPTTRLDATLRNGLGMEFVLIPAGTFQMGSNDQGAWQDEKPVYTVRISRSFYLGKTEVTQGQWQVVVGSNPSHFYGNANLPVENVSRYDVEEFLRRLQAREPGARYRLPTEAEWEYAARAGTQTAYSFGDDVQQLGTYAWHGGNAGGRTHPVGQKQPNAWGLYDMHGNVWEWVQDWYSAYASGAAVEPTGPAAGASRVFRGGSWNNDAGHCRTAYRNRVGPGDRFDSLGFRLLREAP